MSETSMVMGGDETRQAMVRVWMAISAIWVTFWLSIALVALTAGVANPFANDLRLFSVIVMAPPVGLLVLGATFRLLFEALFRKRAAVSPAHARLPRSARP